jgi:ATP-dependent Clp protease adaptor protein ClpS
VEAIVLLVSAFGASGALWAWQNRARIREEAARKKQIATMLDESMQVALELAKHAATTRNQPLAPLHVLYAIVQDETVAAAIDELGGDRTALDNALDKALDALDPGTDPRAGKQLLGSGLGLAYATKRMMTLADALITLDRGGHASLLDAPPLSAHALVFRLVHGSVPPATLARETHVHVILRNDDYTTQDFVVHVLRDVFELPEADAVAKMRATHETGRAIVGRYAVAIAQDKVETVRRDAAKHHMPLWIGVEVC